ncbi:MAG: hypothetical protein GX133_01950 [Syntrophomonadaceae bacterium]|nr:hypothetical protein [Syntrophomonadaceae bacterium]
MNKLEGFYELNKMNVPSVPWQQFTGEETLDANLLWTVRAAVETGKDFNLPRAIGVTAEEAIAKGKEFLADLAEHDLVIYYPYFMAIKSGVIDIQEHRTIIEAVDKDLWNLTTRGHKDLTIIINHLNDDYSTYGNSSFLEEAEVKELLKYAARIRSAHRNAIFANSSVLVEWCYAVNTNAKREMVGEKHLMFMECRTIDT